MPQALLLAGLFKPEDEVATAERRQPGLIDELLPEEAEHVSRAIAKRKGEFAAGRACARQALQTLGIEGFPLRAGPDRRPLWPQGIVGSITHTSGFYGAVAARSARCAAIGVDAETVSQVGPHLWPKICTESEIAWLNRLPAREQMQLGALIFSAKEAFYKCQYGLTESWVGFQDIELDPATTDLQSGRFQIRPNVALNLTQLIPPPWTGRCGFDAEFVTSGLLFPRSALEAGQRKPI